jgi:hypothetical protein
MTAAPPVPPAAPMAMMSPVLARTAAGLVALLALAGLVLEYQTYTAGYSGPPLFWRTLDYLSFFTVEANVLVGLVAAAAAFPVQSPAIGKLVRPAMGGATCLYAVVSGVTYLLILRHQHHPEGLAIVSDNLVHYIVPAAFLALWLAVLPKGGLDARTLGRWLIFPAVYFAYALFRGPRTGFSPYPFIDVARFGLGGVALNVAALAVAFLGFGALIIALDRALAARQRVAAG